MSTLNDSNKQDGDSKSTMNSTPDETARAKNQNEKDKEMHLLR